MSLRLRLMIAVLLTAVPLVAGMTWLVRDLERRAVEQGLRDIVVARMESGERERCEESPETFGGGSAFGRGRGGWRPRRPDRPNRTDAVEAQRERERARTRVRRGARAPMEIWAYDASFQSANPAAPHFPDELRAELAAGDRLTSSWSQTPPPDSSADRERERRSMDARPSEQLDLGLRMPWDDGPCAIVLVLHRRPAPVTGPLGLDWSALIVGAGALLAVLFAAGPPMRRIRRLTEQVRQSSEERYARPVAVRGRDEIGRLAGAFNDAAAEIRSQLEQLERREEALRSFLGNTTHDVMVPLTVLQGHLTSLRRRVDAAEPVDPDVLVAALDETQYIASLLHNLGAMAKLEGTDTEVRHDPVQLGDLVERAVARHRPLAKARGIEMNSAIPEDPVEVTGDVTLLEQAVSNVIHNAVRYNEAGGHIAVILIHSDGEFSLRVLDDGPGIPPDEMARLAERRFRGEAARTRHPDGHGLGLHIARDVAARHGIELELRASEYDGLEVEFRGTCSRSEPSGERLATDSPPGPDMREGRTHSPG